MLGPVKGKCDDDDDDDDHDHDDDDHHDDDDDDHQICATCFTLDGDRRRLNLLGDTGTNVPV